MSEVLAEVGHIARLSPEVSGKMTFASQSARASLTGHWPTKLVASAIQMADLSDDELIVRSAALIRTPLRDRCQLSHFPGMGAGR